MSDIRIYLSDKNHGIMTYQSVVDKILARIRRFGRGHVCTPRDFVDLASRASVDQALSRLVRAGQLRRIGRGLYDYPKTSARLGVLAPSPKAVERALARRSGATLKSSAGQVANALGVSTQVPMRTVLETTGRSRTVTVQGRTMRLVHRAPSKLGRPSGVADDVIRALSYLGTGGVDDTVIHRLAATLRPADKRALLGMIRHSPGWLHSAIRRIATEG